MASALLAALMASGHRVSITDDLYFANFGHLHDGGREVMMPFWIDTQIAVPASRRSLLLPVSHSEQELHVRGPKWNADVSFYFGIDGKAEFRTMDSLNQSWVMHRAAFTYTSQQQTDANHAATERGVARLLPGPHGTPRAAPSAATTGWASARMLGLWWSEVMEGNVLLFPITHDRCVFSAERIYRCARSRVPQGLRCDPFGSRRRPATLSVACWVRCPPPSTTAS